MLQQVAKYARPRCGVAGYLVHYCSTRYLVHRYCIVIISARGHNRARDGTQRVAGNSSRTTKAMIKGGGTANSRAQESRPRARGTDRGEAANLMPGTHHTQTTHAEAAKTTHSKYTQENTGLVCHTCPHAMLSLTCTQRQRVKAHKYNEQQNEKQRAHKCAHTHNPKRSTSREKH